LYAVNGNNETFHMSIKSIEHKNCLFIAFTISIFSRGFVVLTVFIKMNRKSFTKPHEGFVSIISGFPTVFICDYAIFI